MEIIKIHTSHKEKVADILNNTLIEGDFWDYTLSYEFDYKNHNMYDLECEHYFNLPEFVWSPYLLERCIVNVFVKNQMERNIVYKTFGLKEDNASRYVHYDLNENPLRDYEYEYTHKIYPTYPIYVITKGRWEKK